MAAINRYNFLRWFPATVKSVVYTDDGTQIIDFNNWVTESNGAYHPANWVDGSCSGSASFTISKQTDGVNFLSTNAVPSDEYDFNLKCKLKIGHTYNITVNGSEVGGGLYFSLDLRPKNDCFINRTKQFTITDDYQTYLKMPDSTKHYLYSAKDPEYITIRVFSNPNNSMTVHDAMVTNITIADTEAAPPIYTYSVDDTEKDNPVFLPQYGHKSFPLMIPGEITGFCINTPLTNTGTATLKIIKPDSLEIVSSLEIHKVTFTEGTIYYTSFITPSLDKGFYRLGLYFDGVIKYASNVLFSTNKEYEKISSIIKYRHKGNIFQYPYESILSFHNQFRLAVIEEERQPDYDIDQYRSISTGKTRNYKATTNLYIKFETVGFDDKANEAIAFMLEHSEIYINNEKVTYKTGYKNPASGSNGKGDFEMWLDRFNSDKITSYS